MVLAEVKLPFCSTIEEKIMESTVQKYNTPLADDIALVLGGSGGIGQSIIDRLVHHGVRKICFTYGKNIEAANKLASTLEKRGVKVYYAPINQSDEQSVAEFLHAATQAMGNEITIAVNAIGISPNKDLEKQTLETVGNDRDDVGWREVFEINVFGCFISSRAIAMRMRKHNIQGRIILITSTNGVNSNASFSAHYDASKAAQISLMRNLAEHFGVSGKLLINGVAPGWIKTSLNDTLPADAREKEMAKIWLGRWAEPMEVAEVIVALGGPAGSFMSGQNIMVDGGYRG